MTEPRSAINALWIFIIPLVAAIVLNLMLVKPTDPVVADAAVAICGQQFRAATWNTHTARDFRACLIDQGFTVVSLTILPQPASNR